MKVETFSNVKRSLSYQLSLSRKACSVVNCIYWVSDPAAAAARARQEAGCCQTDRSQCAPTMGSALS